MPEPSVETRMTREKPEPTDNLMIRVTEQSNVPSAEQQAADETARQAKIRHEVARVREQYVRAHPELPESVRMAILDQQVVPGMTRETAFVSLGVPERVTKSVTFAGTSEQWAYPGRFLYFEDGILSHYTEER